jgi:AcrR family transcriptional regulator
MRALADRLGSSTATLYRRVGGKDEILTYVADRVLGEVATLARTRGAAPTWDAAIIAGAESLFEVLRAHPKAVVLFLGHVPAGPNALLERRRPQCAVPVPGSATLPRPPYPPPIRCPDRWRTSSISGST